MSAWRRLTCIFPEDGLHLEWRVDILVDLLTDRRIVDPFGDSIDIFLNRPDLFRQGGRKHAAGHHRQHRDFASSRTRQKQTDRLPLNQALTAERSR
jgi:hypothetical protein